MNKSKLSEILNRAAQGQSFTNRQEVDPNVMDIEGNACGPCIQKLRNLGYDEPDWCAALDRFKSEYRRLAYTCEPFTHRPENLSDDQKQCREARRQALNVIKERCKRGDLDPNSQCCFYFGKDGGDLNAWTNICHVENSPCFDILQDYYTRYRCGECNVRFLCRMKKFNTECMDILSSDLCQSVCPKKEDRIVNR